MTGVAGSRTTKGLPLAFAVARAHGARIGLEILVNFALPFAAYAGFSGRLGAAPALMAASVPPTAWSIAQFLRARRVDAISLLVLSGIVLSLLAFAGGGGVKVLQLRENLVAGLVGLVFLGSAAIGRPLIYQLARAGTRRRSAASAAAFEALRSEPRFRRAMTAATLLWGVGLVSLCALNGALVFLVSIKRYLLLSPPIGYATLGLLTAWTFWYVPRARREAEARLAAREAAAAA